MLLNGFDTNMEAGYPPADSVAGVEAIKPPDILFKMRTEL
jgi:hypothetical protein